jgi:hypothetical protein
MKILSESCTILKKEYKVFLLCCAFYWGLFVVGMLLGLLNPSMATELTEQISEELPSELPVLTNAYLSGNVALAFILTF